MSLAQRMHVLLYVFQMTAIALMTPLEFVEQSNQSPWRTLFRYGTNLLIDGHFEFSNELWIAHIHVVLQEHPEIKIWEVQIKWMQRPLGFTEPADKLLHHDVGCMRSCLILLEPLHILIHTMTCSKCPSELVQCINVKLFYDSDYLLFCIFKPKESNYSMFWNDHKGLAFHRVQGLLKHLIKCYCTPVHTVIASDMSTEPEVCFVAEPNTSK